MQLKVIVQGENFTKKRHETGRTLWECSGWLKRHEEKWTKIKKRKGVSWDRRPERKKQLSLLCSEKIREF